MNRSVLRQEVELAMSKGEKKFKLPIDYLRQLIDAADGAGELSAQVTILEEQVKDAKELVDEAQGTIDELKNQLQKALNDAADAEWDLSP